MKNIVILLFACAILLGCAKDQCVTCISTVDNQFFEQYGFCGSEKEINNEQGTEIRDSASGPIEVITICN